MSMTGSIPADRLLAAVIQPALADGWSIERLAEAAGVSDRRLRDIVHRRTAAVRFTTADALVAAVDVNAWFDGPLADLYGSPGDAP